jgi:hypothetical protein
MDEFKELQDALDLIEKFQRSAGSISGDCSGVLAAVRAKIKAYIQRKTGQLI